MRSTIVLAYAILSLVACSGVDIQQSSIDRFNAGNYRYYRWRTDSLRQENRSSNAMPAADSVVRTEVDDYLQSRGYVLDPQRAQCIVHYLYGTGMVQGERSALASNISVYPTIMPTRRVDQASVDNAIALGGVKETNNLIVQFNDRVTNQEVWRVTLTEIVDNANSNDTSRPNYTLTRSLQRALQPIPQAPGQ